MNRMTIMRNDKKIDVSFVMTVYNKEKFLPSVLKTLLNQTNLENPEYIFVDDLSTDKSVDIIKEMTSGLDNVIIVENKVNQGISIRINQGINLANGEYIRMLDSDDIFPLDSTSKMIEYAKLYCADMVYGTFTKTGLLAEELTEKFLNKDFKHYYKKDAMLAVLCGKFTRMGQLIKTDVLKRANGADEKVLIQDESIPLRAAFYANGVVKMFENVVLVPKEDGNLSGNKVQLDYDRFFAYYNFLNSHKLLENKYLRKLNQRAVSAYWKFIKKDKIRSKLYVFLIYTYTKQFQPLPNYKLLDKFAEEFRLIKVLRPKKDVK